MEKRCAALRKMASESGLAWGTRMMVIGVVGLRVRLPRRLRARRKGSDSPTAEIKSEKEEDDDEDDQEDDQEDDEDDEDEEEDDATEVTREEAQRFVFDNCLDFFVDASSFGPRVGPQHPDFPRHVMRTVADRIMMKDLATSLSPRSPGRSGAASSSTHVPHASEP